MTSTNGGYERVSSSASMAPRRHLITHRKVLMADTRNGFEPPQSPPRWDRPDTGAYVPRQPGPRHGSGPGPAAPAGDPWRSEERGSARSTGRADRNPWHWLLLIPIVV